MSARCSAAVYERYPAGGGEFALALALADNAHEDGTHIFPSVETMAVKSRQSVRSVQRGLRHMLEIGWLQVVKNGRGGRGVYVEYRINPDWLKGADLSPFSRAVDNPEKGDKHGTKRVTNEAQKGDKQSTPYITNITSIEPNTPLPPLEGGDGGFSEFFKIFPKQSDEDKARDQWDKLAPDTELQATIIAAVLDWRSSPQWQKEGGSLVPKPHNWLRNKGWRNVPGIAPLPRKAVPVMEAAKPAAPMPDAVRLKIASILGPRARKHRLAADASEPQLQEA